MKKKIIKKAVFFTLYEIKMSTLTLPHDEVNDFLVIFGFPESNSSAKPQEQSLHAFLLPVVPQTAKKKNYSLG